MAAGEGVELSASSSKPDVLPVTPSRVENKLRGTESRTQNLALIWRYGLLIRRLPNKHSETEWSRWQELNRHRSIINRVLWPLSYTALVDPTGLKPAPHGLKGRCSVTRAPGQNIGCGGRIRTFDLRINSAGPYQLGYATRNFLATKRHKKHRSHFCVFVLLCGRSGCGDES